MSNHEKHRSRNDLYVGAIFVTLAIFFGSEGGRYDLGAAGQVGPGLFPVVLSILLFALGIIIGLQYWRAHSVHEARPVPWRAIGLVCFSLFLFGYASEDLGLVPVVFICTALTALSSSQNSLLSSAIVAAVMTLLCFAVFKLGLGINLPTFGPLFGF